MRPARAEPCVSIGASILGLLLVIVAAVHWGGMAAVVTGLSFVMGVVGQRI
jgi:hypothetical protein